MITKAEFARNEADAKTRAIERARGLALEASNDLHIVLSWLKPPNPDSDDNRDPATMIRTYLQEAERHAEKALEGIKRLRATASA